MAGRILIADDSPDFLADYGNGHADRRTRITAGPPLARQR